jgi:hypothetical protein
VAPEVGEQLAGRPQRRGGDHLGRGREIEGFVISRGDDARINRAICSRALSTAASLSQP